MQQLHAVQVVRQAKRPYARSCVLLLERPYASPRLLQLLPARTFRLALGSPRTVFEPSQTANFRPTHSASTRARTKDSPCEHDDDPNAHEIAARSIFVPQ